MKREPVIHSFGLKTPVPWSGCRRVQDGLVTDVVELVERSWRRPRRMCVCRWCIMLSSALQAITTIVVTRITGFRRLGVLLKPLPWQRKRALSGPVNVRIWIVCVPYSSSSTTAWSGVSSFNTCHCR